VLDTMRFRKGMPVGSDRHLARYLNYVSEFPRSARRPWSDRPFSLPRPPPIPSPLEERGWEEVRGPSSRRQGEA
jgi:hypothetical protein